MKIHLTWIEQKYVYDTNTSIHDKNISVFLFYMVQICFDGIKTYFNIMKKVM